MDTQNSLQSELEHAGLTPVGANWVRMTGGRSNIVWRVGDDLVCKLFLERTNPLFSNSAADEFRCLQALRGHAIAPEPTGRYRSFAGEIVLYRHIDGKLWQKDTAAVARLLGRLHSLPVPQGLNIGEQGWGEIASRGLGILSYLPPDIARMLGCKMPAEITVETGAARFVHGDVVPANIIDSAKGLRLIDWQSPAVGDPVIDLFCFLSPAMQIAYGDGPLQAAEASEFLAEYPARDVVDRYLVLCPILHWRMAAYCAWRVEQGEEIYDPAMRAELTALERYAFDLKQIKRIAL